MRYERVDTIQELYEKSLQHPSGSVIIVADHIIRVSSKRRTIVYVANRTDVCERIAKDLLTTMRAKDMAS